MSITYLLPQGTFDDRFQSQDLQYFQHSTKRQRTDSYQMDCGTGYEQPMISQPTPPRDCDFDWSAELSMQSATLQDFASLPAYPDPRSINESRDAYPSPQLSCTSATPYPSTLDFIEPQHAAWMPGSVPCDFPFSASMPTTFPNYTEPLLFDESLLPSTSARIDLTTPIDYAPLVIDSLERPRKRRSTSFTSNTSSIQTMAPSDVSRSTSPNASEMARWGRKNRDGTWSCAFQGCTSRSTFNRGCDLRKHYKRHTKSLFCRHRGCPQATEGGFSSKKDRARHEAKHNPNIMCEWDGCERMFSRVDNMVSLPELPSDVCLLRLQSLTVMTEGPCSPCSQRKEPLRVLVKSM